MNWQKIRRWTAMLSLLALSVSGFWGVDREWVYAGSLGAKFSTFMQTAFAVLGVLAAASLWYGHRWTRTLLYLWALTLILTGATAPVIWGDLGWGAGLLAAAISAVIAGTVVWIAPLPSPGAAFSRWRWLVAGAYAAAAVAVLAVTAQYAPLAVQGRQMEEFCRGLPVGITERELQALAEKEGYIANPGSDAKGGFLRIQDDASRGHYFCEARFKPDGRIDRINFTARAGD
ncbi:MAG TPA: hypothetical protein VKT74_03370 [Gammaproteobacteria bacterium]|nr:hypothetical protein [Gammaproteobacteria bacterium]